MYFLHWLNLTGRLNPLLFSILIEKIVGSNPGILLDKLMESMGPKGDKPSIDERFAEWFSGFVDAEGTFIIRIHENSVSLAFRIK